MEIKRVLSAKMLGTIIVLTFINCFLFVYIQLNDNGHGDFFQAESMRKQLIETYQGKNIDEGLAELKSAWEDDGAYAALDKEERKILRSVTWDMISQMEYIAGYHARIAAVIEQADNLSRYSIFTKENSVSKADIAKTARDYANVLEITPYLCNDRAVSAVCSYTYVFYICVAIMVLVMYRILNERENGMWGLIYSAQRGRMYLGIRRIGLIAGTSFLVLAVNYILVIILSFLLYGGWSSIQAPIQNIQLFRDYTIKSTVLQYFCFSFFYTGLVLFALSLFIWLLFVLFRNRNMAIVVTAILFGAEFLLYNKIMPQSVYHIFREANVIQLLEIHQLLSRYLNCQLAGYIFSMRELVGICSIILGIAAMILSVLGQELIKPQKHKKGWLEKIAGTFEKLYQRIFANTPLIIKEMHKLLFTDRGIWIVLIMTILTIYFLGMGRVAYGQTNMDKDKIYLEHGGENYSYILECVQQAHDAYEQVIEKTQETARRYEKGEANLEDLTMAASEAQQYARAVAYYEEFEAKAVYLSRIEQEYHVKGYMISDRGYEQIFGEYSGKREFVMMMILITGINLVLSKVFLMEYQTGMRAIIKSAAKGRSWIIYRKAAAAVLLTVGLYLLVYGIDFAELIKNYGLPYLDAPLMSLTFMESVHLPVSILAWIMIRQAARLVICLVIMVIAVVLSDFFGRFRNNSYVPFVIIAELVMAWILLKVTGLG